MVSAAMGFLKTSGFVFAYSVTWFAIAFAACSTIEFFFHVQRREGRKLFFNLGCTAIYFLFDAFVGTWIALGLARGVQHLHGKLHVLSNRPGVGFAVLLIVASATLGDLGYYWIHRWQHASPWLWAAHSLHHSDEDLNLTTTFRTHWLENPPRLIAILLPSVFLPAPMIVVPATTFLFWCQTFLNHSEAPISLGSLNRFIVNTSTHRLHHSVLPEHIDKNFGGIWSFWDVLFGTYVAPKGAGERPPTSFEVDPNRSVAGEAIRPFRVWAALMCQNARSAEPISSPQPK